MDRGNDDCSTDRNPHMQQLCFGDTGDTILQNARYFFKKNEQNHSLKLTDLCFKLRISKMPAVSQSTFLNAFRLRNTESLSLNSDALFAALKEKPIQTPVAPHLKGLASWHFSSWGIVLLSPLGLSPSTHSRKLVFNPLLWRIHDATSLQNGTGTFWNHHGSCCKSLPSKSIQQAPEIIYQNPNSKQNLACCLYNIVLRVQSDYINLLQALWRGFCANAGSMNDKWDLTAFFASSRGVSQNCCTSLCQCPPKTRI